MTDRQLDRLTAGGASVTLALSASAAGQAATTSTEGIVRSAHTTLLNIYLEPGAVAARLLSSVAADVFIAAGQAEAKGESNAQCSATVDYSPILTIVQISVMRTITTTSAICSCLLFAVDLPH